MKFSKNELVHIKMVDGKSYNATIITIEDDMCEIQLEGATTTIWIPTINIFKGNKKKGKKK